MAGFRVFFVSVEFRVFEIAREEVFFFTPAFSLLLLVRVIPHASSTKYQKQLFCVLSFGRDFLKKRRRSAQRRRQRRRRRYERTRTKDLLSPSVCLSRGVVVAARSSLFLLSLSNNILSLSLKNLTSSQRGRRDQSNQFKESEVRTLSGKKKNNNTANNKNGQTRTGTNHRRARLARPHEAVSKKNKREEEVNADEKKRMRNVLGSVKKVRKSTENKKKKTTAKQKTKTKNEKEESPSKSSKSTRDTTIVSVRSKSVTPASEEEKKDLEDDDPRTFDLLGNVGAATGKKEGL